MSALHKNMTVTRTISVGNCTGTSDQSESAGFPFARRHSSAGILALKWATARSSSFGSSLGSENRGSKDSIRSIVVTPESIPQFTIPKLALEDGYRSRVNEKERQGDEDEDWGSSDDISSSYHPRLSSSVSSSSSSSGLSISPVPGRKANLSSPLVEAEHCSDPASRAALSLPHLPKVTTPYGFVTLSKSPQMANEEALFFQGHRRWGHDEEMNVSRHPKLEMKRSVTLKTSPIQTHASTPPHQSPVAHRFLRSHSVTGIEIQKQLAQSNESVKQVSKSKRSLWGILRKADRKSFDFNSNFK
ncbi:C2 calcium-dependent domain-containing 4C-like protein [Labeo rohita]|uniref:C2 calcium-dependent domain-containing 4C-like protein n=1 Tax=Labeo rohita TaxID=84645 RepID=A0A498MUT2_LABRO|nr:C2 calcium-dependent domain-containing 4C-like protein [Labeo rohita]RXN20607.1 C2 calcium-dependent domain-containing 4C-like protein [Labeo rohita]